MASSSKQTVVKAGNAQAVVNTTVTDSLPAVPCPQEAGYTYIGARYIPIFADPIEWNSKTTYEPLTIVTYKGDSYTSKTFVPTGIDITDTDYWAKTAGYNAQVEQYREEVKQWQGQIDKANETSDNALDTANRAIGSIHTPIMLVFGDSYSEGTESQPTFWWEFVRRWLHADAHNFAISGYGLLRAGKTIRSEVQTAIADSSFNHDDVLHVFLMCGCNDYWNWDASNNAYYNEIMAVNNLIKTNFPNCTFTFIQNGWPYSSPEKDNDKVLEYSKQMQNASCECGFTYINCADALSVNDALFQSENKHPTSNGEIALGYAVLNGKLYPSNYTVNSMFKGVDLETITFAPVSVAKINDTVYERGQFTVHNWNNANYIRFDKNMLTYCTSVFFGTVYALDAGNLKACGLIMMDFTQDKFYLYVYDATLRSNTETEYFYYLQYDI